MSGEEAFTVCSCEGDCHTRTFVLISHQDRPPVRKDGATMNLQEAIDLQPEHSAVVYEHGQVLLQRTLLLEEQGLDAAFDQVPWRRLVFLRCERQKGGKRALLYRWRAAPDGWETKI